jgi:hypothetical protein
MTSSTKTERIRRRVRRACLALIGVLFVVSVPWYREAGTPMRLWLGLPDWVAVALGCYVAVAFVNAVAWLVTDIEDDPEQAATSEPGEAFE